ncbi:hypothetical protein NPIL_478911, partial [Nephila pilipes]
ASEYYKNLLEEQDVPEGQHDCLDITVKCKTEQLLRQRYIKNGLEQTVQMAVISGTICGVRSPN